MIISGCQKKSWGSVFFSCTSLYSWLGCVGASFASEGDFFFRALHPWSSTGFKHGSAVRICPCKMKIPNLATNQNHFQVPFLKHLGGCCLWASGKWGYVFSSLKDAQTEHNVFFSAKILQYFALVIRTRNIIFKCSHSYFIHTDLHIYMCVHTHLYSLHVHMPCSLWFYLSQLVQDFFQHPLHLDMIWS